MSTCRVGVRTWGWRARTTRVAWWKGRWTWTVTAWRWEAERTVRFSGTASQRNVSGTLTRTHSDGHTTDYTWDAGSASYLNTNGEGEGAHDSVKFDSATSEWVWTDGSSRQEERYGNSVSNSTGRLNSQSDTSGNKITYVYETAGGAINGRLLEVVDVGSGQKIKLVYSTTSPLQVDRVETFELNVDANGKLLDPPTLSATPIKQVEYVYDNGRIGTVKTILNRGGATARATSPRPTRIRARLAR